MLVGGKNHSRPSNSLTQRLDTSQNTSVVRGTRQIRGVLPNQPIQKLLERLSRKSPKENQSIRRTKTAFAQLEQWCHRGSVESVLQNNRPDPRSNKDQDDGAEGGFGSGLDENLLAIEQIADHERGEDSGKVGKERRESTRFDSLT